VDKLAFLSIIFMTLFVGIAAGRAKQPRRALRWAVVAMTIFSAAYFFGLVYIVRRIM
jgi:hypothetical protein